MIQLKPLPVSHHQCPYDNIRLNVLDWCIPGMRNLADLSCPECHREFYGDLPAGHGLYYPMLLEKKTGEVYDKYGVSWFAKWLHKSYYERCDSKIEFIIEEIRPLKNVIILNCLDVLYGHCLLKLLNAQFYLDKCPEFDLVVLIPRLLRWMVPEGVAGIWSVDVPLSKGMQWNDSIDREIKRELNHLEKAWLSIGLAHPYPSDFSIERFTKVKPFKADLWLKKLDRPVVSFIWRSGRYWTGMERVFAASKVGPVKRLVKIIENKFERKLQERQIIVFAKSLQSNFPNLVFNIIGIGEPGGMPNWVNDLRRQKLTPTEEIEWCKEYARSHVVVGMHGSNMLLPSAHAGSVVEIVPLSRWANLIQDILPVEDDIRFNMYSRRFIPSACDGKTIANCVAALLKNFKSMMVYFTLPFAEHFSVAANPQMIENALFNKKLPYCNTREQFNE